MKIEQLQKNWDEFGKSDPLWSVLTSPEKKNNKWDVDEFFAHGENEINEVMQYVTALGLNLTRKRALDFGCGVGRLTQALAAFFERVDGVDIAPSMVERAEKYNRHGDQCRYFVNETDDLRLFPDETFDFIYSCITLQHMKPRYARNYIKEFLRVLTPEGVLIFQVPSRPILLNAPLKPNFRGIVLQFVPKGLLDLTYRRLKYRRQPRMEGYWINRKKMVAFLQEHGARLIDVRRQRRQIMIDCRYCVAKR